MSESTLARAASSGFPERRRFIARSLCAATAALELSQTAKAQPSGGASAAIPGDETRLALLLGNRDYPVPFDLPPIPKNVRDLRGALERRGFMVTDALDLDLGAARQALNTFIARAASAPVDSTLLFYFAGHGVQVAAANLLLPAGLNPSAREDALRKGSMQLLDDVVRRLPERKDGITIAVVDACRTTFKGGDGDTGLNQVEAPPGCLIAFSTGAGKPAIAPAVETQNTFYTASLVKLMASVSDETSFADLFQLVKADVRNVMLSHPVQAIRRLAQDPFIADHTRTALTLAPRRAKGPARERFGDANEANDWAQLEQATWPADVLRKAEAFLQAYPSSKLAAGATVARDGARGAAKLLQRSDVKLYRSAFQLRDEMDPDQKRDLARASHGDKDAAARLGRRYKTDAVGAGGASRYEGWLQYASALGNGIASYELALYYRRQDQPLLASQLESRARELGYTPPPTLDNVRK